MYTVTAVLYVVLLILSILAWRLHQTWFQAAISTIGVAWTIPLYIYLSSCWVNQHGGWVANSAIGWGFLSILGTIAAICMLSIQIRSIMNYIHYADPRLYPNISLKEYNQFLAINPEVWKFTYGGCTYNDDTAIFVYQVKNTAIDEIFVMSYWEYMWLRITRALDVDARSRLSNVTAKARLADAVQKDLDKLRIENQIRLNQSLKNIEKMKKSQSDLLTAYGDHLQTYEDLHIRSYGESLTAVANQTLEDQ